MSVRCPKCGTTYRATDAERNRRNLDLGRCTACEKDKTDAEVAAGHWKCQACRRVQAEKQRRKRARAGLDEGAHVYRARTRTWR